jgi:hypothetical protein
MVMIVRPDKRHGKVFDILVEFKFVALKSAGLSARDAAKLSREELENLPPLREKMEEGEKQVRDYGVVLEKRYQNLRLEKYVVVSIGFERICWKRL